MLTRLYKIRRHKQYKWILFIYEWMFLVGIEKYLEDNKVMELKQRFEDFADDMEFCKISRS